MNIWRKGSWVCLISLLYLSWEVAQDHAMESFKKRFVVEWCVLRVLVWVLAISPVSASEDHWHLLVANFANNPDNSSRSLDPLCSGLLSLLYQQLSNEFSPWSLNRRLALNIMHQIWTIFIPNIPSLGIIRVCSSPTTFLSRPSERHMSLLVASHPSSLLPEHPIIRTYLQVLSGDVIMRNWDNLKSAKVLNAKQRDVYRFWFWFWV